MTNKRAVKCEDSAIVCTLCIDDYGNGYVAMQWLCAGNAFFSQLETERERDGRVERSFLCS